MGRRSPLTIPAAALAAVAVWWSAAAVGVVDDHGAHVGYVVPGAGLWLVAGMAAAALVQWFTRPATVLALAPLAAPALLPAITAAWCVAGRGVALVWAGWMVTTILAWAPRLAWRPRADARWAAAAGTCWLAVVAAGVWPLALTGDAPHYLTITQSLLRDGDLDLANDYDARTYLPFYRGSLEPRHTNLSPWGPQYSFHGPGVSVLVLPGFALAGTAGATVTLVVLLGLASGLFWSAVSRVTHSRSAAWAAWAALVTGAPYALHAAAIYPDGPAAVATIAAIWLLVTLRSTTPTPLAVLAASSIGLAALPWLHPRLALPAAVLGLAIAGALVTQPDRWTRLAWFFMVPVISAAGWVAAAYVMFDTWNPTAAILQRTAPGSWGMGLTGLAGMVADREFGLCPTSPVMLAAPLGLAALFRRDAYLAASTAAMAFGVWATSSFWVWWGGDAAPARFLVVALPALALWIGQLWATSDRAARVLVTLAIAAGASFTGLLAFVDGGSHAYNFSDGRYSIFDTLSASVDVAAALPSFAAPPGALTTEFAVAGIWLALIAILIVVTRAWGSRIGWPGTSVLGMTAIAAACSLGWSLRPSEPWTRGSAALTLLQALRQPVRPMTAGVGARLGDPETLGRLLALRTPELIGRPDDAWLYVPNVPAGRYAVAAGGLDPALGRLTLAIGRDAQPIASWRAGDPPPEFTLPVAVHSVRVTGTSPPGADVWLSPLAAPSWPVPSGQARRLMRLGGVDVYAMDDSSYQDGEALWVLGNRAAAFAIAADRPARLVARLDAGPAAADLRLVHGTATTSIRLEAGDRREVELGVVNAAAPLALTVLVEGGFPASVLGNTRDTRQLGVKLAFEVSPG